jgi:hypothetical protein
MIPSWKKFHLAENKARMAIVNAGGRISAGCAWRTALQLIRLTQLL